MNIIEEQIYANPQLRRVFERHYPDVVEMVRGIPHDRVEHIAGQLSDAWNIDKRRRSYGAAPGLNTPSKVAELIRRTIQEDIVEVPREDRPLRKSGSSNTARVPRGIPSLYGTQDYSERHYHTTGGDSRPYEPVIGATSLAKFVVGCMFLLGVVVLGAIMLNVSTSESPFDDWSDISGKSSELEEKPLVVWTEVPIQTSTPVVTPLGFCLEHWVVEGDTLTGIVVYYLPAIEGLTLDQVIKDNNLVKNEVVDDYILQIGEKLQICTP